MFGTLCVVLAAFLYLVPIWLLLLGALLLGALLLFAVDAALSLACAAGYLARRSAPRLRLRMPAIHRNVRTDQEWQREKAARIASLDPDRQFAELMALTTEFESRAVREAALARATVVHATVQPADHARLAAGARSEHRSIAKPRRRRMLKTGGRLFRKVAVKFVSGGVDLEPAIARFRSVPLVEELDG